MFSHRLLRPVSALCKPSVTADGKSLRIILVNFLAALLIQCVKKTAGLSEGLLY